MAGYIKKQRYNISRTAANKDLIIKLVYTFVILSLLLGPILGLPAPDNAVHVQVMDSKPEVEDHEVEKRAVRF